MRLWEPLAELEGKKTTERDGTGEWLMAPALALVTSEFESQVVHSVDLGKPFLSLFLHQYSGCDHTDITEL